MGKELFDMEFEILNMRSPVGFLFFLLRCYGAASTSLAPKGIILDACSVAFGGRTEDGEGEVRLVCGIS